MSPVWIQTIVQGGALALLSALLLWPRYGLLATHRDLVRTNTALLQTLAGMGQRLTSVDGRVAETLGAVEGLRRDFARAGVSIVDEDGERETPEPPRIESTRRPRTDPTGRGRR